MNPENLIRKYNVPAPRYTSYPPVPFWNNQVTQNSWTQCFQKAYKEFGQDEGISLYIHLPFCESLCTYCGCNKRITKNHQVEIPYISTLMKEWSQYLEQLETKPKLAGIHLGGGTPTFFSPAHLGMLLKHILGTSEVVKKPSFSFEGHPNNTTNEHLKLLSGFGFDRVSYGIQDFNTTVQKAIHRIQPFEKVLEVVQNSRELGYNSINFDLIYGLPHQNLVTLKDTFEKVATLQPERIAFYSYAHLPSAFPSQKPYEEFLPDEQEKRKLYEQGKKWLLDLGYEEIGMDHFALPDDPLVKARDHNTLHRNFMGYTTSPSKILLGLGCSAISDFYYAYGQNDKNVENYKSGILKGIFPIIKGHRHSTEDLAKKALILDLICRGNCTWQASKDPFPKEITQNLLKLEREGLIIRDDSSITVLEPGRPFIRNICMAIDPYMSDKEKSAPAFSKAI